VELDVDSSNLSPGISFLFVGRANILSSSRLSTIQQNPCPIVKNGYLVSIPSCGSGRPISSPPDRATGQETKLAVNAIQHLFSSGQAPFRGVRTVRTVVVLAFLAGLLSNARLTAQVLNSTGDAESQNWCQTQKVFQLRNQFSPAEAMACAQYGPCDDPVNRNIWIPTGATSFTTVRIRFHVVANTDGTNQSADPDLIAQNFNKLNANYVPSKINFEYTVDTIRNSTFRSLADNEIDLMKQQYAVKPDSMLNIYIAYVEGHYSFGTFPWDNTSKTVLGGIVMTTEHFDNVSSALAHEVGHCLGLWHTFNGVSEVGQCSSCYEKVGASDHDVTGDRCADTDPTPLSYSCGPPGGKDTCTGLSWGPTDVQNYMGYSGDACWSEFSPQQMGRMHCWLEDKLLSWTSGVRFTADTTLGAVPFLVAFNASSPKVVTNWAWTFGDGGTSNQQNPVHAYTQPGLYSVQLSIQSNDGPYTTFHQGMVGAFADSIKGPRIAGTVGHLIEVDVSVRNFLPLRELVVPLTWDGPAGLFFDSANTTGLRTDYMALNGFLTLDPSVFMRGAYRFMAGSGQSLLSPGNGTVLRLFFTVAGSAVENPISFASFDNGITVYSPKFVTGLGSYEPVTIDGSVAFCKAGDINNDNLGPDLADLSYLVLYLTGGTVTLPNPANANVNGVAPVNIADLSYMVSYLTTGSPSLICQ
jgi:hypothetical protein